MKRVRCAGVAVAFGIVALHAALAADTADQKSEAERRKTELQQKLRGLRDELARSEASRNEVRDALRASEAAISEANRVLRELEQERDAAQQKLAASLAERERAQAELDAERERLASLVRAQYFAGRQSPWQTLLDGGDPNEIGRRGAYLGYIARARQHGIEQLEAASQRLAASIEAERQRNAELAAIVDAQARERATLERQKHERAEALRRVSNQVLAQRREVGALERDATRLNALIDKLGRVLADEARRERQRLAERQRREREARSATPKTPAPAEDDELDTASAFQPSERFASLRGRLRLPVNGEVLARFGRPRQAGVTWKGIFIRAAQGVDVRAVASGRVVFSDWLRGFGNLLILDHGGGYLSVYGGNEALLRKTGDVVKPGEAIATVGASGGAEQPGLYFELRHKGAPFDPLSWVR
ncbi:MAG TPA: peptidoglycan DD-metalloendopeptidase family protein [Burkholderiaceae bacterium]|nr:peptidoglycan DD-metalloendopeptidase family protein [Burkholderiaceae bacterium]